MRNPLLKSLAIHLAVLILFLADLPFSFWREKAEVRQVPIIVDLNNVKISEMTNLPPKAKMAKEDKKGESSKKKDNKKYNQEKPKESPKAEEKAKVEEKSKPASGDEKPVPPKQDFLVAPKADDKSKKGDSKKPVPEPPSKKPTPPQQKKPAAAKDNSAPELANPLKSLLASVDEIEKRIGSKDAEATIKEGTDVQNTGIEGGIGGSYFSELSISEIDAIAGRLRACWNLDPGAMGIENMVVEIRAQLNRDGTVKDVKIVDSSRYANDTHFRSVADSARRAVYICAPYSIFSEKYAEKYDLWNTLLLRFNPLDGGVN